MDFLLLTSSPIQLISCPPFGFSTLLSSSNDSSSGAAEISKSHYTKKQSRSNFIVVAIKVAGVAVRLVVLRLLLLLFLMLM